MRYVERREQAGLLRAFLITHPGMSKSIGAIINQLKLGEVPFGKLTEEEQDLLRVLVTFGAVQVAVHRNPGLSPAVIRWKTMMSFDYASRFKNRYTCRVREEYVLPDLTANKGTP
jgi:hypothetical protein